jgi:hypothetical protein
LIISRGVVGSPLSVPIEAAKPRLDSNGTSASRFHSTSSLSDAAALTRGGLQDPGRLRFGDAGERAVRIGRRRYRTHQAQPVFGERAGLVEADRVDAAQRLDGARSADQHAAGRQPLSGGELRQRRHQWQTLRNGRHSDRDAVSDGLTQRRPAQQRQTRHRGSAGQRQRKHLAGQLAKPCLHAGRRLDVDDG